MSSSARSSDCSSSSEAEDGKSRKRHSQVISLRFQDGLCHLCGTSLYEVTYEDGKRRRLLPRTVPGKVDLGRCLYCYPERGVNTASTMNPLDTKREAVRTVSSAGSALLSRQHDEDSDKEFGLVSDKNTPHAADGATTPSASTSDVGKALSIQDADGVVFSGTILEGTMKQGRGSFAHIHTEPAHQGTTSTYKGDFLNGKMHGQGTCKDVHGCVYEGSFRKGAAHGDGTATWVGGWTYQGEWVNDKRHGRGVCRQQSDNPQGGQVYTGDWKFDEWHGEGSLEFAGGGRYDGDFRKGKLHGRGRYVFSDGSQYEGMFSNDLRRGLGNMTYADGSQYVGEWRNNWRHGDGTMFFADGTIFKGKWRGDDKHGLGYLHLTDGILLKQRWIHGELQNDQNNNSRL